MNDEKDIPVIIKRNRPYREREDSLEVKLHQVKEDRKYFSQEQVGIDKIVEDSQSNFYITGKTVKIGFMDLLNLLDKHKISEIANLDREEVVVSSRLITQIATAEVADEDEDKLQMIDATAVGLFMGTLLLALFGLITKTMADIKTFSWVILGVSAFFLVHYTYRGVKSGEIKKLTKAWLKKASRG